MKYRLKHIAEYALLRSVAGVANVLPYRFALGLGWCIAAFSFHILRWRRDEAERRIRSVFPDYSDAEVRRTAWLSLRNMGFNAIEMIAASRLNRAWLAKYAECGPALKILEERVSNGQGAILAVAHMGNWDAAGIGMEQLGIPMLFIARSQKNPLVNDYMNGLRSLHDSVVVDRDDPKLMKKAISWLEDGNVLAILIDLHAKRNATMFEFLDQQASVGRGIGLIARHSQCPVYPAITLRKGWAQHEWSVSEPIVADDALDRKADSIRITGECLRVLGDVVRANPDQYFWYNKRWVLDPPRKSATGAGADAQSVKAA